MNRREFKRVAFTVFAAMAAFAVRGDASVAMLDAMRCPALKDVRFLHVAEAELESDANPSELESQGSAARVFGPDELDAFRSFVGE